jgi:hypothetical protein
MYIYSEEIADKKIDVFCMPVSHLPPKFMTSVLIKGTGNKTSVITEKGAMNFVDDKVYDCLKMSSLYQHNFKSGLYFEDAKKLEAIK